MSHVVGIVGSRSLPASFSPFVSSLVSALVSRGFRVASGGAVGADQFALSALVEQGLSASGVVYSAWSSASGFPVPVRPLVSVSLLPAVRWFGFWFSVSASLSCCFRASWQEQPPCFCLLACHRFRSRPVPRHALHHPSGGSARHSGLCVPLRRRGFIAR